MENTARMKETFANLHLCVLNYAQHANTCDYWYVIGNGSFSHTAFRTLEGLELWLKERGLSLTQPLTAPGVHSYQKISGEYCRYSHYGETDVAEFNNLNCILETRTLDNGRYTLAKITENEGIRTVHTVNCNYKRIEFDYKESAEMMK